MDDPGKDVWPPYYIEEQSLGSGAYGGVVQALDKRSGKKVAIKKQFTNFSVLDKMNKPVLALRAYRELLLLWTFRGHTNILHLVDAFPVRIDGASMATLCTVTDKMDMDLAAALRNKLIRPEMIPFIVYSILCGIKDLKPSNVGITFEDGNVKEVKLLDFGLARKLRVEMSYVVQTMWYRAPEVWLQQPGRYTKAIDIWSVVCILAELISGEVLMRGGSAFNAQLQTIYGYLGDPSKDYFGTVDPGYHQILLSFENIKKKPLPEALKKASKLGTQHFA